MPFKEDGQYDILVPGSVDPNGGKAYIYIGSNDPLLNISNDPTLISSIVFHYGKPGKAFAETVYQLSDTYGILQMAYVDAAGNAGEFFFRVEDNPGNRLMFLGSNSTQLILNGSDFTLNGSKMALGYAAGAVATASSAAIAATETVVLTARDRNNNPADYRTNSTYKVVISGGVTASVASNTPLFRIRKTDTVGQQFDAFRVACINTSSHPASYTCYFQTGATVVNADIVLTLTGSAGFNAVLTGAATSPATMTITHDGPARTGLPTLV